MPAQKEPQLRRGRSAWEAVRAEKGDSFGFNDENRLPIHSVDDRTALTVYMPELRTFLVLLLQRGVERLSVHDADRLLAQ